MNKRYLFKQLNSLCLEMDNNYCINNGGCCYVAAVIAEQLEIHHIPFTVIYYDLCGCHYAIRVSDRIINRSDYSSREIISDRKLSSKYLYNLYNINSWNKTYNKKWNSIVKIRIKALFRKYNKI